jgi:hypothetical protein
LKPNKKIENREFMTQFRKLIKDLEEVYDAEKAKGKNYFHMA